MKKCSKCQIEKPFDDFYKKKTNKDGYYGHCKECQNEYGRSHYKDNVSYYVKKAKRWKASNTVSGHNISKDHHQQMLSRFNSLCWICKVETATVIDHDHDCNRDKGCEDCVRGVLCRQCNWGLGNFRDNPDYLLSAIKYLQNASVYPLATNESKG